MRKIHILISILAVVLISALGYFYLVKPEIDARKDGKITQEEKSNLFKLGLDLAGGSQLTYEADMSQVKNGVDVTSALKDNLMRRLNPFGTSEVSVLIEDTSVFAKDDAKKTKRVIIQIPGESNPEEARKKIGKMPLLEFKIKKYTDKGKPYWKDTGIKGVNIEDAVSVRRKDTGEPVVTIKFDREGGKMFGDLTSKNVGGVLGIFLDNKLISDPVINEAILGGSTQISFGSQKSPQEKMKEADSLAENLRYGSLPVPLKAISSTTVSPTLGKDVLEKGLYAGVIGLILVIIFLIVVYRFAGVLASIALISYIILTLSIFKALGFVFTTAGIAGFIISIGMAVDANVLIFEMTRERLRSGKKLKVAIEEGFKDAWTSIRDGNLSSLITAIILFYLTTPLVRGFAITFGLGVLTSMFSAIVLTRTFLLAFVTDKESKKIKRFLFGKIK